MLLKWEHWVVIPRSTESRVQYGRRVLIRSARGLDEANQVFYYDAKESYLEVFEGRTICPDGTVAKLEKSLRHDELLVKGDGEELRAVKFAFSKVRPGCIVEWNTTVRYKGTYTHVWWEVQETLPVLSALFVQRFEYGGPDLARFHFTRRPFEAWCTLDEGHPDGVYARWEARCRNVPALDDEPLAPPEHDSQLRILFRLSYGSLKDLLVGTQVGIKLGWREVIKRYTATGAKAAAKGQELAGGTVSERLDRILDFLAREIEAKSDSPLASNVDEVLETKRAYSLERTMLAYAMMQGAGLTVVPVLLTDRSRQRFSPEIPEPGQYVSGARIVLRVEDASGRIFVDPACRYCRPGYPDWRYASTGTGGIVLDDDAENASLILIDSPSAESNAVQRRELINLHPDGSADVEGRVTWSHQSEVVRREHWRELTAEARTESFLGPLAGVVDGAVLTVDPVGGASPLEGRFRYVHPNFAKRAGDELLVPAGDGLLDRLVMPTDEKRRQPVAWRYGRAMRVQSVFRVPDGFAVAHTPAPARLGGPGLRFDGSWERGEGDRTIVFTGRIVISNPLLEVADYPAARDFALQLDDYLRQGAVLTRAGNRPGRGGHEMSGRATRVLLPLTLALAALVAAATGPVLAVARYPLPAWAAALRSGPDPAARFPSADAVVLLDEWTVTASKGERTGERHWAIRVMTEDGIAASRLGIGRSRFQDTRKVRAWVRDPDGTITSFDEDDGTLVGNWDAWTLDDSTTLALDLPGVEPGSTVFVSYRFRFAADLPQDFFPLQRDVPVALARVTLATEGGTRARARVGGGSNPGPDEVTQRGSWEFRDLPGWTERVENDETPRAAERLLVLNYATGPDALPFEDWGAVARWSAALFVSSPDKTGELDALVKSVRAGGGDPVDTALKAARGLRYFAVEIGWGGLQPRPVATTLARGLGDCKDKSFVAELLRRLGIEAVPVLIVAPRHRFVDPALPGPFVFNHAVTGIPWSGREVRPGMIVAEAPGLGPLRLVDPTLGVDAAEDLHFTYEGARALPADARATGLIEVPRSPAAQNRLASLTRIAFAGAAIAVDEERSFGGVERRLMVDGSGVTYDAAEMQLRARRRAEAICTHPEAVEATAPRAGTSETWTYTASYRCAAPLVPYGERAALALPVLASIEEVPLPQPDDEPVPLAFEYATESEVQVTGRAARALPPPIEAANTLGRVTLQATAEGDTVTVRRSFSLSTHEVKAGQREEAKALRRACSTPRNRAVLVYAAAP